MAQEPSLPAEVIAYADTVLYNGKILTADDNFTIAEAVAVRDGKFLAVGASDRIEAMAGPETRKIDLQDKTAVPGILDIHQHPSARDSVNIGARSGSPEGPSGPTRRMCSRASGKP